MLPRKVINKAIWGSIPDLETVCATISRDNYSTEVLDLLLTHLEEPRLVGTTQVPCEAVAFTVLQHGLLKIITACPPSLAKHMEERVASNVEGILYWMDVLIGEDDDSAYKAWKFLGPHGQTGPRAQGFHICTKFLLLLIGRKVVATALGPSPTLHSLLVRWWLFTCDREVLLYTWEGRGGKPHESDYDYLISLMTAITQDYAQEMAQAIMNTPSTGGIPAAQLFARRTNQRLASLNKINVLRHLNLWPDETNESENVQGIVQSIVDLMRASSDLRVAFLKEDTPSNILEASLPLSTRFLATPLEETSRRGSLLLVGKLMEVVSRAAGAPFPMAMYTMKRLIVDGLLDIVADYIGIRKDWTHKDCAVGDNFAMCILTYTHEVSLCPRLTSTYGRAVQSFVERINGPLASPELEGAVDAFVVRFQGYLALLPRASRIRVCDNLDHHRVHNSAVVHAPKGGTSKACACCHTVVYCSTQCQTYDWKKRHRDECRSMRVEHSARKALGSWYSHNLRTFHLTSIIHQYATEPKLWNVFKGRRNHLVDSRIVVSAMFICPHNPFTYSNVDTYVRATRSLIPEHKRKRFDEIVARFKAAKAHSKRTSDGTSFLSLGLVNGIFRIGDEEINYIVLIRRIADTPLPGKPSDFEVEGYLVYTCQGWDRVSTCWSPMQHYRVALAMGLGIEVSEKDLYDM
ncbi:hypothetical protein NMY22_g3170 [Coprinellus aureogranulatus]|nr:hypothetical protein NMY22_g3170 [Coprinellus aureogranulatus]